MELILNRVVYGKKVWPFELREYCIEVGGPVGCFNEWLSFAEEKGYTKITMRDKIDATEKCRTYNVKTKEFKITNR